MQAERFDGRGEEEGEGAGNIVREVVCVLQNAARRLGQLGQLGQLVLQILQIGFAENNVPLEKGVLLEAAGERLHALSTRVEDNCAGTLPQNGTCARMGLLQMQRNARPRREGRGRLPEVLLGPFRSKRVRGARRVREGCERGARENIEFDQIGWLHSAL